LRKLFGCINDIVAGVPTLFETYNCYKVTIFSESPLRFAVKSAKRQAAHPMITAEIEALKLANNIYKVEGINYGLRKKLYLCK